MWSTLSTVVRTVNRKINTRTYFRKEGKVRGELLVVVVY